MRRLIVVGLGIAALVLPGVAHAGYGVQPNGQTLQVQTDSFGYIQTPTSIDFLIYLDSGDTNPTVWVSTTPQWTSYGTPVGESVGVCSTYEFTPWSDPNNQVCRISTIQMKPNTTYYWWLDLDRRDPGQLFPTNRQSGPFSFTLASAAAIPPTSRPPTSTPPVSTEGTNSTATASEAALLPASERFDGGSSVKQSLLGQVIYKTMKLFTRPRTLAVACWDADDFDSVVAGEGEQVTTGSTSLLGFWKPSQPHWMHLSPGTCRRAQNLLDTKAASGQNGVGLATALHEAAHAYGIRNEALANCLAVQLVPVAATFLGLPSARATYLGSLTVHTVRRTAPTGYWDYNRCRDGGTWDFFKSASNLK